MLKFKFFLMLFLISIPLFVSPTTAQDITITANSGSAQDIQLAVDQVITSGGDGTVYLPDGTFLYPPEVFKQAGVGSNIAVRIPGGINVIGVGATKSILKQTTNSKGIFFEVDGRNGKAVRISGIKFQGFVTDESYTTNAIAMLSAIDFRIDHNHFDNFASSGILSNRLPGYIHRGVIDHNIFDNTYKESPSPIGYWQWGYGVNLQAGSWAWKPLEDLLGKYDDGTVFIEDNTFLRQRHAVASNTAAWYVFRHNHVTISPLYGSFGKSGPDVHEGSATYYGGRGLEAYGNTIIRGGDYGEIAFFMRGGGGVIYNNTIQNVGTGVWMIKADWATTEQNYVKDLYIWGNNFQNVGGSVSAYAFYQENVHYFLSAKEGYTPYQYPHPLTTLDGSDNGPSDPRTVILLVASATVLIIYSLNKRKKKKRKQ